MGEIEVLKGPKKKCRIIRVVGLTVVGLTVLHCMLLCMLFKCLLRTSDFQAGSFSKTIKDKLIE